MSKKIEQFVLKVLTGIGDIVVWFGWGQRSAAGQLSYEQELAKKQYRVIQAISLNCTLEQYDRAVRVVEKERQELLELQKKYDHPSV